MKKIVFSLSMLLFIANCSSNKLNDNSQNLSDNDNEEEVLVCNHSDDPNHVCYNDNHSGNDDETNDALSGDWLIPVEEIMDGGTGKDGIPSIDNPEFVKSIDPAAQYLESNDLVVGIVVNGIARAYPHEVLDWHEIVNDTFDNEQISISYCPLTGTAFAWKGESNQNPTTFGVSGLLYNGNLILYDRATDSNWSQLKLQCVNGSSIGEEPQLYNIVESTWNTWKSNYPNTKVLTLNTGYVRDYGTYPYGPYREDHDFLLFPISETNTTLPSKERVHAIIDNNTTKAYQLSSFVNGNLIRESINGNEYLIVGHDKLINSFELTTDNENLDFELDIEGLQIFFTDNEGNKWDVLGTCVEGPRSGEILSTSKSVMGYWFAIAAFYPNPEIYSE